MLSFANNIAKKNKHCVLLTEAVQGLSWCGILSDILLMSKKKVVIDGKKVVCRHLSACN